MHAIKKCTPQWLIRNLALTHRRLLQNFRELCRPCMAKLELGQSCAGSLLHVLKNISIRGAARPCKLQHKLAETSANRRPRTKPRPVKPTCSDRLGAMTSARNPEATKTSCTRSEKPLAAQVRSRLVVGTGSGTISCDMLPTTVVHHARYQHICLLPLNCFEFARVGARAGTCPS